MPTSSTATEMPYTPRLASGIGCVKVPPCSGVASTVPLMLQTAVVRSRKVRLVFANRTRERTERLVDPWGLVDKDEIWYLPAGTEEGQRTFRVDRIVAAVVTDLAAERPADFELSEAWQRDHHAARGRGAPSRPHERHPSTR